MDEKNLVIDINPETLKEEKEEFKTFLSSISGMELYYLEAFKKMEKMEQDFQKFDEKYISKLSFNFKDRIEKTKETIEQNQNLLNNIVKIYKPPSSFYEGIDKEEIKQQRFQEGKYIYNVFTYILRDWTIEREKEREESYGCIIKEVIKHFPPSSENSKNCKILIPGSGLNRLGYELCKLGYDIEGNDYLYLNGIFTDFIFNHTKKNQFFFCPNIDGFSNYFNEDSVHKKYYFPDIDINLKSLPGNLKIYIGDFLTLYDNFDDYFDCIITCYFIDTGQNIIEYIDIIHRILRKGGIWINFGPLSYHWTEYSDYISIELPYDKLKEVICNYGFKYINESFKNCTFGYIDDYMHNDFFKCINFTVKKD
jgi:carnosine N-methyltransferase